MHWNRLSTAMDIFNDEFLPWQLAKFLLCSFGAWPFQSLKVRKILSTLTVCLVESLFIPEVMKLIEVWSNLAAMMDCMPALIPYTIINVSLFICLHNLDTIGHLLSLIDIQWNESDLTESELNKLKQDGHNQRKIMILYAFLIVDAISLYLIVMPMVPKFLDYISPLNHTRPKMVLYHTEFFIDQEKYALFFAIHSSIVTPLSVMILIAYNILYFNFIQHACTMFNILEFTQMIDTIFNLPFLIIICLNLIGICSAAFQVLSDLNMLEKMRNSANSIAEIAHLYFLCWYSQKLINSSEQINQSIGKWYNIPIKSQRLIVFMMMRCRKPCTITAGGFLVMSIETFSNGMKTAMSYLTVLRSMQ